MQRMYFKSVELKKTAESSVLKAKLKNENLRSVNKFYHEPIFRLPPL